MTVFDLTERIPRGSYLRHLRDEAHALGQYFEERGTNPEEVYDILDAFRYIGLSQVAEGASADDRTVMMERITDMIEDFRSQQGLPGWAELTERVKSK